MKLYYFTNSYPFGLGEMWKTNELSILRSYFEEITVVPFSFGGNKDNPKPLPKGVTLFGPLFPDAGIAIKKIYILNVVFNKYFFRFFFEFFKNKVFLNKWHLVSWLSASLNVIRLSRSTHMIEILNKADSNTILYFYWGKGSSEILPFIDTKKYYKTFVRMHRYDLFEYTCNNYIPYRGSLLNSIDIAASVSLAGKLYLQNRYPKAKASIHLVRCGTIGNDKVSKPSNDTVLRVVSCSHLIPVKRVHLMIESLQFIDFPILWRHIGDGVMMHELKALVEKLGLKEKFIFEGMMDSRYILDFYSNSIIDVFVNTSENEGVPISIMEAFSAGIPVIATNVGGTQEIVEGNAGELIDENISPVGLSLVLSKFYTKGMEERQVMREEAYSLYSRLWDARKLTPELATLLQQ